MSTPYRPTEFYALARITMQERLNKLPKRQRDVVILNAAGYTQDGIAAMFGYRSKQAISYLFNRALDEVGDG